ncbi:type II toxin-antitoxin system death-on-curing family toxin [Xenorhabdus bovienii]|uniref:type II toxin-antitoxin system death-on-curing family toxin n=1 Tax=Xenorhabdus bovienii TaxID=40576 RepID=UPI0030BA00C8
MNIRFLSTEEVIEIQRLTLPNSGNPDINKLEGALFRIQTLKDYDGCEDIFKFAAMYLIAIAKSHAFNDANKRTAFQCII